MGPKIGQHYGAVSEIFQDGLQAKQWTRVIIMDPIRVHLESIIRDYAFLVETRQVHNQE